MKIKRLFWILVACATLASAQPPEPQSRKIIEVKHVNTKELANLLSIPFVSVQPNETMRVLVVSGPASAVATIEEMVKKLDIAPPAPPARPNIELMGYLVFGSPQAKADEVPAEIAPAIKQLHSSFQYKSYRMLDSFAVRGRDGQGANTSGVLPIAVQDSPAASYQFDYRVATVSDGPPRIIHIDQINLRVSIPMPTVFTNKDGNKDKEFQYTNSSLHTNIDVREGQKVVVGKSNINANDDALILIVTAKVVE